MIVRPHERHGFEGMAAAEVSFAIGAFLPIGLAYVFEDDRWGSARESRRPRSLRRHLRGLADDLAFGWPGMFVGDAESTRASIPAKTATGEVNVEIAFVAADQMLSVSVALPMNQSGVATDRLREILDSIEPL